MLKSHLLTAFRSLLRNKTYSIINVAGLAVSIGSCLVLFFIVRYELSFDSFHVNKEKIYRIVNESDYDGEINYGEGVPAPLPGAVRLDFPQLKEVATVLSIPGSQIDVFDQQQKEVSTYSEDLGVFFVEPQFFNIFTYSWLHGTPEALKEPNAVVLSRETAEKYFGTWDKAIDMNIEYRNTNVLKVVGVIDNPPAPTDFPFKVVVSYATRGQETSSWGSVTSRRQCYILLDEQTTQARIQSLLPGFKDRHHDPTDRDSYHLQPLNEIHFDERFGTYNNRTASKSTLWSLAFIGVLLLVTASINFINLAIAQVMKRTKEVGVRKVLGSSRWQLSGQFFGEVLLILLIASMIGVLLTEAALPSLQNILQLPVSFSTVNALEVVGFLVVVNVVIALLAGLYPAKVISAFKPVQALKSRITSQTIGGVSVRKGLVVVQFGIAQILVIATLVILDQMDYFRNASLGFEKKSIALIAVPGDSTSQSRFETFRNELLQQPEISNASFSMTPPMANSNRRSSFNFDTQTEDAPFEVNVKFADAQFFDTYNLTLVAGRLYTPADTAREFVVNETFLKRFGITNPQEGLGKTISVNGRTLPIVGVLKDFHLLSLQEEIEPMVMMTNKSQYRYAGIKIVGNATETMKGVEQSFRAMFPGSIFEYRYFDENVDRQYAEEERLSSISRIFSGIAIFISCLGLYGLISFMAVQRTKEVGVRKVLGASVKDIVLLFYNEFIMLVFVAFVVAAPLTGYLMSDWLNSFAYRVELSPWIFVTAITLSLVIAIVTISAQSIKAALANPVNSLRSE